MNKVVFSILPLFTPFGEHSWLQREAGDSFEYFHLFQPSSSSARYVAR